MHAGEEDKWRKHCKKMNADDLRTTISDLQEEKKRLETMGPLDTKNDWSKVNRKIEIANRVLEIKKRGGFISR